ncbi:hypothetical protein [Lysinibacillus sp. RC79]|uniref:hypothetical protein n=1 Tax=Lysinibacillus sp. RC79 TaxID=3156296 RepID=UPI003511B1CB
MTQIGQSGVTYFFWGADTKENENGLRELFQSLEIDLWIKMLEQTELCFRLNVFKDEEQVWRHEMDYLDFDWITRSQKDIELTIDVITEMEIALNETGNSRKDRKRAYNLDIQEMKEAVGNWYLENITVDYDRVEMDLRKAATSFVEDVESFIEKGLEYESYEGRVIEDEV